MIYEQEKPGHEIFETFKISPVCDVFLKTVSQYKNYRIIEGVPAKMAPEDLAKNHPLFNVGDLDMNIVVHDVPGLSGLEVQFSDDKKKNRCHLTISCFFLVNSGGFAHGYAWPGPEAQKVPAIIHDSKRDVASFETAKRSKQREKCVQVAV